MNTGPEAMAKRKIDLRKMDPEELGWLGQILLLQQELQEHGIYWTPFGVQQYMKKGASMPPHLKAKLDRLIAEMETALSESGESEAGVPDTPIQVIELEEGQAPGVSLPPDFYYPLGMRPRPSEAERKLADAISALLEERALPESGDDEDEDIH